MLTWAPVIGLIYYMLKGKNPIDNSLTFGLLTGPMVTGLLYELFEVLSLRFNKRSFRLHASGAKDMRGLGLGFPLDSRGYKWTDMLFSITLILVWIGWPMIFIVLIHLTTK